MKRSNQKSKIRLGFTLIELLVVISIIGILTTLVAANLNSARSRARDTARKSDVRNIATALRLYFNDWNKYPPGAGTIGGCGTGGATQPTTACPWGSPWANGTDTVYMTKLPADPLPSQSYYYMRDAASTDKYVLSACLENKSDSSGVAAISGVNWSGTCDSAWVFVMQP